MKISFRTRDSKTPENPEIESIITNLKYAAVSVKSKTHEDQPAYKARNALDQLFLEAQGIEWRDRNKAALRDCKQVTGGDAAALEAYSHIVCEHVRKLNSLTNDKNLLSKLLPHSRTCLAWPVRISRRKVFGEDADELISRLEVGKDTIAGDPAARFNPKSKFGKLAWEIIARIEQCRNTPACILKFPRNSGQGAENLRKESRYVHECKTDPKSLRC